MFKSANLLFDINQRLAAITPSAGTSAYIDACCGLVREVKDEVAKAVEADALELQARRLVLSAREVDWSPCQQRVLNVFSAFPLQAFTAERIKNVGEALYGPAGLALQPFLTALVRRKVLRSRIERGERLYELNLI